MAGKRMPLASVVYTQYRKATTGTRFPSPIGVEITKQIVKKYEAGDPVLKEIVKPNKGNGYHIILDVKVAAKFGEVIRDISGVEVFYSPPHDGDSMKNSTGVVQRMKDRNLCYTNAEISQKMTSDFKRYVEDKTITEPRAVKIREVAYRMGRGYRIPMTHVALLDSWQDDFMEANGGKDKFKPEEKSKDEGEREIVVDRRRSKEKPSKNGLPLEKIVRMAKVPKKFGEHVKGRLIDYRSGGTVNNPVYNAEAAQELVTLFKGAVGREWERMMQEGVKFDRAVDGW